MLCSVQASRVAEDSKNRSNGDSDVGPTPRRLFHTDVSERRLLQLGRSHHVKSSALTEQLLNPMRDFHIGFPHSIRARIWQSTARCVSVKIGQSEFPSSIQRVNTMA